MTDLDLSGISDEQLQAIAGGGGGESAITSAAAPDLSSISDEQLAAIAGGNQSDWNALDSITHFGTGIMEGTSNLVGLAADLNPIQSGGPNFKFPASTEISSLLSSVLPKKDPQYRYARTIGQYSAPIPGGSGATLLKTLLGGIIAGTGAQGAEDVTGDSKYAPVIGALAATGLATAATTAAKEYGPKLAQVLDRKSIGAQQGDFLKSAKRGLVQNASGDTTTSLANSIDQVMQEGVYNGTRNPAKLVDINTEVLDGIEGELSGILKNADSVNTAAPITPTYNISEGWIKTQPASERAALTEALDEIKAAQNQVLDGSLEALQAEKRALYGKTYGESGAAKEALSKYVAADLKNTIEDGVESLVKQKLLPSEMSGAVKALNQESGAHQAVRKIFERTLAKAMTKDPISKAANIGFTTGGITGTSFLGSLLGGPMGAVIGGGIGLAGKGLTTPTGQALTAKTLRGVSAATPELSPLLRALEKAGAIGFADQIEGANDGAKGAQPEQTSLGIEGPALSQLDKPQRKDRESAQGLPMSRAQTLGGVQGSPLQPTATTPANQSGSATELSKALNILKPKGAVIPASVKQEIAADPYLHALALTESSMDPSAKNPKSSAKGLFQFVDSTAKAIGLSNALDPAESLAAVKKLTNQIDKIAKGDPMLRYAGHYLGETLLKKVVDGKKLTEKEAEIVASFNAEALPNFQRNFEMVSA